MIFPGKDFALDIVVAVRSAAKTDDTNHKLGAARGLSYLSQRRVIPEMTLLRRGGFWCDAGEQLLHCPAVLYRS
jgi:hypothetical protein